MWMEWWGRGMEKRINRMVRRCKREKGRLDVQRRYEVYEVGLGSEVCAETLHRGKGGKSMEVRQRSAEGAAKVLKCRLQGAERMQVTWT